MVPVVSLGVAVPRLGRAAIGVPRALEVEVGVVRQEQRRLDGRPDQRGIGDDAAAEVVGGAGADEADQRPLRAAALDRRGSPTSVPRA